MKYSVLWAFLAILISVCVLSFVYFGLFHSKTRSSLSLENFAKPLTELGEEFEHKPTSITLAFTGDIMLDRTIRTKAQQQGFDSLIGPHLRALLQSVDYGVANLEGPITTNQSVSVGSEPGSSRNFIFTFPAESTTFLKNNNLTILNVGNNHILNFGTSGLAETYQFLDQAQLNYFGFTGSTQPANTSTYIVEKNGYKIGFVNYNQFITGGEAQTLADIAAIRPKVDYLILYTHWGNEYQQENQVIINLAHTFVDAGVDTIIGSHPHIINGHEVYKGKDIFYSLGNFIFDQYFDEEVKKGLVVVATINPRAKQVTFSEHPVTISPANGTELAN